MKGFFSAIVRHPRRVLAGYAAAAALCALLSLLVAVNYDINDYGWHYRMVDLHAALDSYESGEPWNFITNEVYADMAAGLDALYEFYGAPELDFAYEGGEEAA